MFCGVMIVECLKREGLRHWGDRERSRLWVSLIKMYEVGISLTNRGI